MAHANNQTVLHIDGLNRRFGPVQAVTKLDLTLRSGDRAVLWGPNGSGKSTVLRCVAGTLEPTAGTVAVSGHSVGTIGARRAIGTSLSQERSFYLRLTGRRNLVFFARLRYDRREAARRVASLEEELELETIAPRRADTCSTGMLQQLGFARALLGEPSLLLLDEPTRSLDSAARERMWSALDRRPELAVLMATHREDDAERCAVRIELPS
jgi:ABC-type multidrug transport system ATPase subunit